MVDFKSNMLSSLVKNAGYNKTLDTQFSSTFGDKTKLTKDELFAKEASLFDAYNKLSDTGKKNFDTVIGMDGDKNTISEKEYRMLKTLLDAEKKGDSYVADNQINIGKNSAINTANVSQLKAMYAGAKETPKTQEATKLSGNDFANQIKEYAQNLPATPTYNALKAEFPDGFDKNNTEHLKKLLDFANKHYDPHHYDVLQNAILKFTDGQAISDIGISRSEWGNTSISILPDTEQLSTLDFDFKKLTGGETIRRDRLNSAIKTTSSQVPGGIYIVATSNNGYETTQTTDNGRITSKYNKDGELINKEEN